MRARSIRAMAFGLAALAMTTAQAGAAPLVRPDMSAPTPADRAVFQSCLAGADGDTFCTGAVTDACVEREGAVSAAGMMACDAREMALWTERTAADSAQLAAGHSPGQKAALVAAQAEFERWRASKCAYAATLYDGGSLARVVGMRCRLETTAQWSRDVARRLTDEKAQ